MRSCWKTKTTDRTGVGRPRTRDGDVAGFCFFRHPRNARTLPRHARATKKSRADFAQTDLCGARSSLADRSRAARESRSRIRAMASMRAASMPSRAMCGMHACKLQAAPLLASSASMQSRRCLASPGQLGPVHQAAAGSPGPPSRRSLRKRVSKHNAKAGSTTHNSTSKMHRWTPMDCHSRKCKASNAGPASKIETCSVIRRGFFIGPGTSNAGGAWHAPAGHSIRSGAPGASAVDRGSDTRGVFRTGLYRFTH